MAELVLLVGPASRVRRFQNSCLGEPPFEVKNITNVSQAMAAVRHDPPAAVVLASNTDPGQLLEFCQKFRELGHFPIIVASDNSEDDFTIDALEAGADDVVPLDISPRELRARVRAHLRRAFKYSQVEQSVLRIGSAEIDRDHRELRVGNRAVALSPKEFALLEYLVTNPDRVVKREEILQKVWELPAGIRSRTLDVHMARLRQKLSKAGAPLEIITVPCVGYRLKVTA